MKNICSNVVISISMTLFLVGQTEPASAVEASPPRATEDDSANGGKAGEARNSLTELEREMLDTPNETAERARAVIESFLSAPTYKERLEFVRDPKRVAPLMRLFYAENPDEPMKFREFDSENKPALSKGYLLDKVETEDFRVKAIAVERQKSGKFLVDWESFVGYCEIPWARIMERRSTEPFLVRAVAEIGDYYNNGFKDDEWGCLQIEDGDGAHTLYAYAKLGSPVLDELKLIMARTGGSHLTLKVAYDEGKLGGKNQLLLTDVIQAGWVPQEQTGDAEPDPAGR